MSQEKNKKKTLKRREYSLGKSQEEISQIYEVSKFKKRIRLNIFLDNLVLGLTKEKQEKKITIRDYKITNRSNNK